MSTKGRLKRCFPGPAVAVPVNIFNNAGFQSTVTSTLAKMSSQQAVEMIPTARKASQDHSENRDTTNPQLVTDFLMSYLEAVGSPVSVPKIWKNTRDEVLWSTGLLPWHRSPVWLMTRVAIQTTFSRLAGSRNYYKEFMVFLVAEITAKATKHDIPYDTLHCLISKTSRRLSKLALSHEDEQGWYPTVERTLRSANKKLQTVWATVAASERNLSTQDLPNLDFKKDSVLHLSALDEYIQFVKQPPSSESLLDKYSPPHLTTSFPSGTLPVIPFSSGDTGYVLAAFEDWVASHLAGWLGKNVSDPTTCGHLGHLIEQYHCIASSHYDENPETISVMLLTCLELWVACDNSATQHYPLMLDYNPEVPSQLLQSLILPLKVQLERLSRVEDYLGQRVSRSKGGFPSVFSTFGHHSSFAVRYFATSKDHQDLRAEIEKWAHSGREDKKAELSQKKLKYSRLMNLYATSGCQTVNRYDHALRYSRNIHDPSCTRCGYLSEASNMKIDKHEWPLPRKELEANATVFELNCPRAFNDWRDATLFLNMNILRSEYHKARKPDIRYDPSSCLSKFIETFPQRLRLISETKPHLVTHRRSELIMQASESSVCVHNGLTYQYLDHQSGCFTTEVDMTEKIPRLCTYQLQHYKPIQQFVYRPHLQPNGPEHNVVISEQHTCPNNMSLEEFKSLGTLPLGVQVQWSNILLQLSLPSIDFKKMDTALVLLQIIRQSGPRSGPGITRDGHRDLCDETFGQLLIQALRTGLQRIKENWESRHALESFIAISSRLLSLTDSEGVAESCRVYLRLCRHVALGWARKLRIMAESATDQDQTDDLLLRAFEIALVCTGTFDVDLHHLKDEFQQPSESAIFIECSIMIQETSHTALSPSDAVQRISVQRWQRLSHRALSLLLTGTKGTKNACMDIAIGKCWVGYRPGSGWLSGKARHWMTTTTSSQSDAASQMVQYNLLSGELRVDGLPLSRLPPKFEQHVMYKVLFGRCTIKVMRTKLAGMEFSAMDCFRGYKIFFARKTFPGGSTPLLAGLDFMVTCQRDDQSYHLLPPRIFKGKLPDHFVDKYVHWYHSDNHTVEFRPIEDPWMSSQDHWMLSNKHKGWIMTRGNDAFLMGMTSQTGKTISGLLGSIESEDHIHLSFQPSQARLNIELPRLNLNFVLDRKSELLRSRQFRGMYLDSNQRVETLIGLKSKVVLKNDRNDRIVLVPDGSVSWKATANHIEVEMQHGSSTKVYPFELDTQLGRILDNGTLESKLVLCYLHALTSFCLPDGLTGKSGTEQALEILHSAAVKSFDRFSEHSIAALNLIAKLTPRRTYYPKHLRHMQDIDWVQGLSPLSQHGQLYTDVSSLLAQVASIEFFQPSQQGKGNGLDHGDKFLIERDLIRSSVFRSSGFGAEHHTAMHDKVYDSISQHFIVNDAGYGSNLPSGSHDSIASMWDARLSRTTGDGTPSSRYDSALRTASRIYQGLHSRQLHVFQDHSLADRIWTLIKDYKDCKTKQTVCQPSSLPKKLMVYDAERFEDWKGFLAVHWCQLHHTLSRDRHDKFGIMILLATLVYAKGADFATIEVLVALFNVPEIGQTKVPEAVPYFELGKGRDLNSSELTATLGECTKPFYDCPEYHSPSLPSESSNGTWDRRTREWECKKKEVISSILNDFHRQWPCPVLQRPKIADIDTYVNMEAALASTNAYVKSWWDNLQFYKYLLHIEKAVQRQPIHPLPGSGLSISVPAPSPARGPSWLTDTDLLSLQAPPLVAMLPGLPQDLTCSVGVDAAVTRRLMDMIARLEYQANLRHEKEYVKDLQESSKGLQAQSPQSVLTYKDEEIHTLLKEHLKCCQEYVTLLYKSLLDGLNYTTLLPLGGFAAQYNSPRLTPSFFLKQLARKRWVGVPSSWKEAIVVYGIAITMLQRAERLLGLVDNKTDLVKELLNGGHENWDPHDSPESLLIEVESGILVRKVQAKIAEQMKHPTGNNNAVMQLNMGEGKSSVIVPIAAAALADGCRLVRVIVSKPQSKQMFQMLVSKLGGLCNHQIYHMPFSRSLKLGLTEVNTINQTYRKCMETGGILLVQPEHILSFQLMGIETNFSGDNKADVSKSLLSTQHFFNTHSRDIVDESDENFSVKFELVYTMGTQRPIDLSPGRWYMVQTVLRLIRKKIPKIQQELPSSVELEHGPTGSFPRTRLLRHDAQECLCRRLAEEICESSLPGFRIARQPEKLRKAVLMYITESELSPEAISAVEGHLNFWTDAVKPSLMLLRGLIAGGVLAFAFGQKRWRVNYGLTPTRRPETRLAVPYRAKDSPALRSEFSHPDVVIVLTCLSYYYGGLEDQGLFTAFEHLMKSDQADNEYEEWVRDAPDLSPSFRTLTGINLKDRYQCTHDIFPHLRHAQAVIDFFLARIIFPKEMKEFPHKLSASGWDIGRPKPNPTTGFSGTNDSKHLLPLTVHHLDLDEQRHTNALVLLHLLQPENNVQIMPPSSGAECADAVRLLQLVVNLDQPAQVILDVGAQVIELSNIEVAAEWLKMTASNPVKQAVVFFDEGDNLMVCDRAGHVEAFQTSPYSKQLDLCYVFLDEAHTRGTDLKLPQDYRAVVTLGAGLTKDRLVQGKLRALLPLSVSLTTK